MRVWVLDWVFHGVLGVRSRYPFASFTTLLSKKTGFSDNYTSKPKCELGNKYRKLFDFTLSTV